MGDKLINCVKLMLEEDDWNQLDNIFDDIDTIVLGWKSMEPYEVAFEIMKNCKSEYNFLIF